MSLRLLGMAGGDLQQQRRARREAARGQQGGQGARDSHGGGAGVGRRQRDALRGGKREDRSRHQRGVLRRRPRDPGHTGARPVQESSTRWHHRLVTPGRGSRRRLPVLTSGHETDEVGENRCADAVPRGLDRSPPCT
eukprot:scaffold149_cov315-Pinguiococcus_pyrenoidosus.AAC.81